MGETPCVPSGQHSLLLLTTCPGLQGGHQWQNLWGSGRVTPKCPEFQNYQTPLERSEVEKGCLLNVFRLTFTMLKSLHPH